MRSHSIIRLLFVFLLFQMVCAEVRIELPDNVVIVINDSVPAVFESVLPFEQETLSSSAFAIELGQNNSATIRFGSFQPERIAAASYEQFRDQWITDAAQTQLRMQCDPIFRDYISQCVSHS